MKNVYATLARFIRDSTAAGRALLTAANAAAQRTALGLGSAAQSDSTDFAAASHTQAWNTITSTPTTLVGYGIANAYTKTETDALVTSLLELKGDLNCSTNPNYPAANKGDAYYITAPGKVGGASGITVAIGDLVVAKEDNAGGTQAAVGTSWFMLENSVTGFMMSSNNLSDLANIATARANLGLGSAALSASSNFATAVHNHDDRYYTESEVNSLLSGLAPSSHAHGNITNAGAIGSTANLPLITTTSGVITTGTFGTTINTFCQGNDSRLSDARTPLAHNQAWSTITSTPTTLAGYGITDAITAAAASSTYLPRTGGVMTGPITFPAAITSSPALRLTPSLVNPTTLADGDMWYAGSILQVRVGAGSRRVAWQNVDNSFIAKQTFLTSTTVSAGVRIPHGTSASLTSPVNGDIWSHTSGWYVRTNGVTEQLCTLSNTATLTNKSISGSTNTFSNIPHTAITGLGSAATASTTDFAAASHNHDDRYFTEAETTSLLAGYQPLDSDLTAIAALTTTAFGRSLLTQVDAASTRTAIGAGTSSFDGAFSSLSGKPTTLAGYGITDAITSAAVSAGYQPLDADLTAIAGLAGTSGLLRKTAANTWSLDTTTYSTFDGAYSSLSGIPSTFTPASHVHGNITNAGAIGSTANLPLITTTSGVITVGSFGTTASTFCEGNDSRLSDARTPTAHNQAWSTITSTPTTLSGYGITDALTAATAESTYLALAGGTLTAALSITGTSTISGVLLCGINLTGNGSGRIFSIQGNTPQWYVRQSTGLFSKLSPLSLSFGSTGTSEDVSLARSGANALRQINGTNAQTFEICETFTSDTSFGSLRLKATASGHQIGSALGSAGGANRAVQVGHFNSDETFTSAISVATNGVATFAQAPVISTISNTGTLTLPTSTDTLVGRATTDTLTNKTLTSPVISTISNVGTITIPSSTTTLVGRDTTDTLTNKRWQKRVVSTTSASSLTPDISAADFYEYTALAAGLTVNNPTGTPVNTELLDFRFRDNGSARSLTWGAQFRSMTATLPTTTVANKTHRIRCEWNATTSTWDCLAVSVQP